MTRPPFLVAVPNISEGRRPDLVRAIAGESTALLDVHIDPDHNRAVLTYAGSSGEVFAACSEMIDRAVASLNISEHTGVHPRFGVVDVLPVVPHGASNDDAVRLAQRFAANAVVPVRLYGRADAHARSLPELRRTLREHHDAHSTAGVICIGVRGPLVAFNVNLRASLQQAREIAGRMRDLSGVRTLAFDLTSRELVQVSMNLTTPVSVGPKVAFEGVSQFANEMQAEVVDAEIVGLIPDDLAGQLSGIPLRSPVRTVEEAYGV